MNVLDIGCGKGGDIQKWIKQNALFIYIGVDNVLNQLMGAKGRINKLRENRNKFLLMQMSGSEAPEQFMKQLPKYAYFNIVSSQFVIHYMFNSPQSVQNLLENMTKRLLDQGFIILTIPDSCVIVKKVRERGVKQVVTDESGTHTYYVYGNKYFSVRFSSLEFSRESIYG